MMKRRWPTVAVVIPNHSRVQELLQAVSSVAMQRYEGDVRSYVVYRPRAGIEEVLSGLQGVIALPSANETGRNSIAVKRNIGLQACTEDLVAFLDDDDIWHPLKLLTQVNALQDQGNTLAVCSRPIYFSGRPTWTQQSIAKGFRDLSIYQIVSGRFVGTSSLLVNGEIARQLQFDERPDWLALEDYDFKIRLSQLCVVRQIHGKMTAYRSDNDSVSVEERRYTLLRALSVLAASAERDAKKLWSQQVVAFRLLVVSAFGGFGSIQEFHGSTDPAAEEFMERVLDGRLFGRLDALLFRMVRTGWRRGWTARPLRFVMGAVRAGAIWILRKGRSEPYFSSSTIVPGLDDC